MLTVILLSNRRYWIHLRKEVIANYPEAAAAEIGTISRLKQICKEHNRLGTSDLTEMLSLN